MTFQELFRRRLLVDTLSKLSESDRLRLLQSLQQGNKQEKLLLSLNDMVDGLNKKLARQNWFVDFGSDMLANITTDSMIWLLSKLLKK